MLDQDQRKTMKELYKFMTKYKEQCINDKIVTIEDFKGVPIFFQNQVHEMGWLDSRYTLEDIRDIHNNGREGYEIYIDDTYKELLDSIKELLEGGK